MWRSWRGAASPGWMKNDGVVWGYDIQYLLTGYLNQHPRTAIAFTNDKRQDYFTFFQELQENEV